MLYIKLCLYIYIYIYVYHLTSYVYSIQHRNEMWWVHTENTRTNNSQLDVPPIPPIPSLVALHMSSHHGHWKRDGIKHSMLLLRNQNTTPKRNNKERLSPAEPNTQLQNTSPKRNAKCPKSYKSEFRGHITQHATSKRKNGVRGVQETPKIQPECKIKMQPNTQIHLFEFWNAECRTQNANTQIWKH